MSKRSASKERGRSSDGTRARLARPRSGRVLDEVKLSPAWVREINRRVRDSENPVRYILASEFGRRFILYYDVSRDVFAMNDPNGGTLFKRRKAAENVGKLLGRRIVIVKFTTKGGKLKRLSPYREFRQRGQKRSGRPARAEVN